MIVSPGIAEFQEAGFPMGGEPVAALDLVDTMMTSVRPPRDLIEDDDRAQLWWELEAVRLPEGPRPPDGGAVRLRAALREVFDAQVEGRPAPAEALSDVNAFAASVPTSVQLITSADGVLAQTRWHTEHGGNAKLASIAREAIVLMANTEQRQKLRRCANPTCSMLFLAENRRRVWCSSAVCGNRARAARHYRRIRERANEEAD